MKHLAIAAAYVMCYALTVFVVTPLQSRVLPEVTVFASLVFFPHGVRVLATWAYGWRAIPGLFLGSVVASLFITPDVYASILEPARVQVVLFGAAAAFLAFEMSRLSGFDFYYSPTRKLNWKGLILIGAIASIVNSVGSTAIYAGLLKAEIFDAVLLVYALGDIIGLIACMAVLMVIFRWVRLFHDGRD